MTGCQFIPVDPSGVAHPIFMFGLPPAPVATIEAQVPSISPSIETMQAGELGSIAAHIQENRLQAFIKSGVFVGSPNPQTKGGDYAYNAWRIKLKGGTITLFLNRQSIIQSHERLFAQIEWAGWGTQTRTHFSVNGQTIFSDRPVFGDGLSNPENTIVDITNAIKSSAHDPITLQLQLTESSKKVLFFKRLSIFSQAPSGH